MEILLQNTNMLFIDAVIKFPLPKKFMVLQIEMYDRTKDPAEHNETYRLHLILHATPNETAW